MFDPAACGGRTSRCQWPRRQHGSKPLRQPPQNNKLGRIDWDALWNEDVSRRAKGQLPNEKAYVRELETRIKERYGVKRGMASICGDLQ